jgi:hypothetical protein
MKDVTLPQIYVYDHVGVHALCRLNHLFLITANIYIYKEILAQEVQKKLKETRNTNKTGLGLKQPTVHDLSKAKKQGLIKKNRYRDKIIKTN